MSVPLPRFRIKFGDQGTHAYIDLNGPGVYKGAGSPETVVTAPVGSLYFRSDGAAGTTLYTKQSGTGNTGWAVVAATPGGSDKNVQYNNAGAFGGVGNNASATKKYLQQVSSGTPSMEQVADADLSTSDITTNNASASQHGFLKKLSGTATDVLTGDGNWSATIPTGTLPTWLSNSPDTPPSSPNAMDDEFLAGSLDAKWTIVNLGLNSVVTPGTSWLGIRCPARVGDSFTAVYQTAPATPWEVTARMAITGIDANFYYGGLAVRDSGTGKVVTLNDTFNNAEKLQVAYWTNPTTFSSNPFLQPFGFGGGLIYLRIKDDGTNLIFSVSMDGVNFIQILSALRTAHLANPNQVGVYAGANNATFPMVAGCDWFRRTL